MKKIIRNAIRCNLCGDEIESRHTHDFRWCSCGGCAVDGGHEYLRRLYTQEGCFTDLSAYEEENTEDTKGSDNLQKEDILRQVSDLL